MQITLPKLKFVRSPNFSDRSAAVDLIVHHDCEGSYTGSVAWFANPSSQVSAHYVIKEDGSEATQMVPLDKKAWHACAFNSRSIGIEMGGYAARGYPDSELQNTANIIAFLLKKYNIPLHWSKGGKGPGFCRHYDLGVAGGHHFDPITDDTEYQNKVVTKITDAYNNGQFPSSWEAGQNNDPPFKDHGVAWAQETLNKLGKFGTLTVDGDLGPKTEAALNAFQKSKKLPVTGKLDFETQDALANVVFSSSKFKSLRG